MKQKLTVLITSYGIFCMLVSLVAGIVARVGFFTLLLRAVLFFLGSSALIIGVLWVASVLFKGIKWSNDNETSEDSQEEIFSPREKKINVVLDDDFEEEEEHVDNEEDAVAFEASLSKNLATPTTISEKGGDTFGGEVSAEEFVDKNKVEEITPQSQPHQREGDSDLSHEVISYDFRSKHKPLSIDGANTQDTSATDDILSQEPFPSSSPLDTPAPDNSTSSETHASASSDFEESEFKSDTVESLEVTKPPLNNKEGDSSDDFKADFSPSSIQSSDLKENEDPFHDWKSKVSNFNDDGLHKKEINKMLVETKNESRRNPNKVAEALATWVKKGNNSK